MRRSFASGWTEPSAFYGERVLDIVYYVVVEYHLLGYSVLYSYVVVE